MSSPNNIVIKLEVQIPTGAAAPAVVFSQPEPTPALKVFRRILSSTPRANDPHPVAPIAGGSGSGPTTGSICAFATFGNDPPADVRALVYSGSGSPPPAPPSGAVGGSPSFANTLWVWGSGNAVPGAACSPTGVANTLAIWSLKAGSGSGSGSAWDLDTIPFIGFTGVGLCGSGSWGMTHKSQALAVPHTYPAVWCVPIAGFAVWPLAVFNAAWALRPVKGAAQPTWDNAADGQSSPCVRLKLCPVAGWELILCFKDARTTYTAPFVGDVFGPLDFPGRGDTIPGVGPVMLPAIQVSAV